MIEEIKQVYGPLTWDCSRWGIFTKLILYFVPTIIEKTQDRIIVYKLFKGDMFVKAAFQIQPMNQCDKPEES